MTNFLVGSLVLTLVDLIWVLSSELTQRLFKEEKFSKPFFSCFVKTSIFLIFLVAYLGKLSWGKEGGEQGNYTLIEQDEGEEDDEEEEGEDEILSPPAFVPINYDTDDGAATVRFNNVAEVRVLSSKQASEATLSRMSYNASQQIEQLNNKLGPTQTASIAVTFCLMWFLANYTYQLALSHATVSLVNVLSSSSSLFALFLSALFPGGPSDHFTCSKLICVIVSICGVVAVSLSGQEFEASVVGGSLAVLSAGFYASYSVFLRKKVGGEDRLDVFLFFGFVGLFNVLLLWPVFFVLNYSGIEIFEWPSQRQWMFLLLNGVVGTVISEVLWVWGCFLTSSLIATISVTLTIPMSMLADLLLRGENYSLLFYFGSLPVFLGFLGVTLLGHWDNWDPVGAFLCAIVGSSSSSSTL